MDAGNPDDLEEQDVQQELAPQQPLEPEDPKVQIKQTPPAEQDTSELPTKKAENSDRSGGITVDDLISLNARCVEGTIGQQSPVIMNMHQEIRPEIFPVVDITPQAVAGPMQTLRRSVAGTEEVIALDVARQILRRPQVLGQTPTENQVSAVVREVATQAALEGIGTSLEYAAAFCVRMQSQALERELEGYDGLFPPATVRSITVIQNTTWLAWLGGNLSFLERFTQADPTWFSGRVARDVVGTQLAGPSYHIPLALFAGHRPAIQRKYLPRLFGL
eukprot:s427_g6.t1